MKPYLKRPKHLFLWLLLMALLLGLSISLDVFDQKDQRANTPMEAVTATTYNKYPNEKLALNQFIANNFMESGLMRTNLHNTNQTELASGEDLLSESVGLLLLYYVDSDQEQAFRDQYALAKALLQKENGLFQWRTRIGQSPTVNASVDDLRIAKALLMGSQKWHQPDLKDEATAISTALLKYCIKDNTLLSYDTPNAPNAEAFYYDFKAMLLLSEIHPAWHTVLQENYYKTFGSRVPLQPFYSASGPNKDQYKMTENALIILHFVEVNQTNENDLRWLRFHLGRGPLYAIYNANGKPLSTVESPAIYGIVAQIGKMANDETLYQLATERLKNMQQSNPGPLYGGYLSPDGKEAYSFDHLMAILGY